MLEKYDIWSQNFWLGHKWNFKKGQNSQQLIPLVILIQIQFIEHIYYLLKYKSMKY
jgi:hypothetical protein